MLYDEQQVGVILAAKSDVCNEVLLVIRSSISTTSSDNVFCFIKNNELFVVTTSSILLVALSTASLRGRMESFLRSASKKTRGCTMVCARLSIFFYGWFYGVRMC